MPALFESEWAGQPGSNYDWSGVRIYEANGTEDGQPVGVDIETFGDSPVVPDADIPRLITALTGYLASRGQPTLPAKLQDLIDAINREGGWRDTDTVGELLTQFLDAEGFSLDASPAERVLDGMRSAHSDRQGEWLGLTDVAEYAGMQDGQAETVLTALVTEGRVERRGLQGGIYRLPPG